MKKNKRHAKRSPRYKLLLDEGLPPRGSFNYLNKFHDLKHITHDYGLRGETDTAVYKRAINESRMVVVFNAKDFKKLIKSNSPSIICVSQNMSNGRIDQKLSGVLRRLAKTQTRGHIILVSHDTVTFRPALTS